MVYVLGTFNRGLKKASLRPVVSSHCPEDAYCKVQENSPYRLSHSEEFVNLLMDDDLELEANSTRQAWASSV